MQPAPHSRAALLTIAFFATSGVLEVVLAFADKPDPGFDSLWEALGRALLHALLAAGLWRGYALCRMLAFIYCLAAVVTYAAVLAMALWGAPVPFPPSVVVQSLFQVPSCVLLASWLRSPAAAQAFPRPLLGR
jgi:hydrogenase/urease accessory protein HupE